ncbi:WD40 repeat domain-containing protein [Brachybacterium sp.]|uniref:WD40 repeat domain-containing protein n=1 Tax=Brachybacterium sp. TaxID=1891286 RepID=UPI003F8D965B
MESDGTATAQGGEHGGRLPRRRWMLGAAALPAALMLSGCDAGIPFLEWHEPGSCLPPSEEIPEEALERIPPGLYPHPAERSADRRFSDSGFAVSPDGTLIAACETYDRYSLDLADAFGVILWDTASGEVVRRLSVSAWGPIAWHPDGTRLAVGESRHIAIADVEGELLWNLLGHELPDHAIANIMDVAYSPDGAQLASTSSDGTVRLWDLPGQQCSAGHIIEPGDRSDRFVSYSPDGALLAVGGASSSSEKDSDNPPELWDPATGDRRAVFDAVEGDVYSIGYSGDGSLLAVTDEPSALMVIGADGSMSEGPVTDSTWFAELAVGAGSRVALLGGDAELLIWDRSTGDEERLELSDVDRLCWSPDESMLYGLSTEKGVLAWDGETWSQFDLP